MSGWKFLVLALALAALASASKAQGRRPGNEDARSTVAARGDYGSIRGRILLPDGAPLNQAVKITLLTTEGTGQVIYTDFQGQYEFKRVVVGNYVLEADADPQRFEIATQPVMVLKNLPSVVEFTLKAKGTKGAKAAPTARAIVSAGELDQNIPKDARKEFERASKAAAEHKNEEAIIHLRKAVALYPNFIAARNDLGAQLLEANRLEEAVVELRAAVRLDPKAFNPCLNLGVVLLKQKQFAEAAEVLDQAISLDPQAPGARLFAGVAQMALKDFDPAEKNLRQAYESGGTEYALALFHLGQLYLSRGERERAAESFAAYLKELPNAPNAEQVRRLLGTLR